MWEWVIAHAADEWRVLTGAPVAAVLLAVVAAILAYFLQQHRYAALRERIEARDEKIISLQDQLHQRVIEAAELRAAIPAVTAGIAPRPRKMIVYDHQHLDPNMSLHDAATYIATQSTWVGGPDALVHDIRDQLSLGKLPSWAAQSSDAAVDEMAPWIWREAQFDLEASTATIGSTECANLTLHRIKLDREMVMLTWPPRRNRTTGY